MTKDDDVSEDQVEDAVFEYEIGYYQVKGVAIGKKIKLC